MTTRRLATVAGAAITLLLVGLLACAVGAAPISLADAAAALLGGGDADVALVVRDLRLPRVSIAALIGAALSLAGAALQGLFRNPLADPYVLGISAGGALGAALALVFAPAGLLLGLGGPATWAFVGAAAAAAVVYRLALVGGALPLDGLLLAGVAVGLTLSAAVSAVLIAARERAGDVLMWLMGHLGGARWDEVAVVATCTALGALILAPLARSLDALLLGEEAAASLGVSVERTKLWVLLACAVLVAGSVAFTGVIGFVGLVVPHVARFLVGAGHRWLLPASALIGAVTLVLADLGARTMVVGELPVGLITGALGGPVFLVLLRRSLSDARG